MAERGIARKMGVYWLQPGHVCALEPVVLSDRGVIRPQVLAHLPSAARVEVWSGENLVGEEPDWQQKQELEQTAREMAERQADELAQLLWGPLEPGTAAVDARS